MYRYFLKSVFDVVSAFVGAVLLLPIFLILIIAIKLDSRGSVLFKQKRVGRGKKIFSIYKFRTMRVDTPKDTPTHLLSDPNRYITGTGRFLRKTSLDELPQIFNILFGQMSIIGPRPALWNQGDLIAERDKYGANAVRPGLSGWAQVNGRDELEISAKAALDGEYVRRMGFFFDTKIFFKTLGKVFKSDGVVEGGTGNNAQLNNREPPADKACRFEQGENPFPLKAEAAAKKVLITGAGSYIGGAAERRLVAAGHAVTVLDTEGGGWRGFDFSPYDCVFHVAGIAHLKEKRKNKKLYWDINAGLPVEVAAKALSAGVGRFVFMSSMSVYGGYGNKNITVSTPLKPKGYYGQSKLQADLELQAMNAENFKVAVLRPPMIFGKGCKGNFPRLAKLAMRAPFFPNIKNRRSMLHIDNLCEFIRLVVENGSAGVFFPQNPDYFNTSGLVKEIASVHGKRLRLTRLLNPLVRLAYPFLSPLRKLFGSLTYDLSASAHFGGAYQIVNNAESVRRSLAEPFVRNSEQGEETQSEKGGTNA
jgi:lipopolysaccharide/colanic/teichoic acid biosynthesis glycosyltransferase/nucleoside-diphosphate-sugar epimerase